MLSTLEYPAPTEVESPEDPRVVVIASSGGGLTALRDFFSAVPARSGVSFVVAQHLPPDHHDLLVESLGQWAKPGVRFVEDDRPLEPDTVSVLPTTNNAIVRDGWVRLLPARSRWERHPALNDLFVSLAESCPVRSVGVLLSGRGSDGAAGLARLEAAGGTVIVQDPLTANRAELPTAGILATRDPWVLPPDLIYSVVDALKHGHRPDHRTAESLDDLDPYVEASTIDPALRLIDERF